MNKYITKTLWVLVFIGVAFLFVNYITNTDNKDIINPDVIFVISGWGDMEQQIMQLVGSLGLSKNVIFAGALWDEDRDRMYQSADLLVMPCLTNRDKFGMRKHLG